METIFKVGDRVFDYFHGWGEVVYIAFDERMHPIKCKFDNQPHTVVSYLHDGRHFNDDLKPALSFTEYKLSGFSQERPKTARDKLYEFIQMKNRYFTYDDLERIIELIEAYKNEKP